MSIRTRTNTTAARIRIDTCIRQLRAAGQPTMRTIKRLRALGMPLSTMLLVAGSIATAHADTVASLLGNFTINQYCGLRVELGHERDRESAQLKVHYVVVFGQLPALRELHVADANGDGVTTEDERNAYVERLAPEFASHLKASVDGAPLALRAQRWTSSLPSEQAGFSLRLDADFVADLAMPVSDASHKLTFSNDNYAGRIGWHEIDVKSAGGIALFDTNAYGDSLTDALTANPKTLPASGPLDERAVQLSFVRGALPAGAKPPQLRPDVEARVVSNDAAVSGPTARTSQPNRDAANASTQGFEANWLSTQTKRLLDVISAPSVPLHILMLALFGALVLGALHAFSPGHGKTVVGAYLIGSRGTPRHAVFLGLIVTITHTLGVFLLGFATLFAAQFIVPERLFPVLSLISGLLVVGIGSTLLVQRLRASGHRHGDDPVHTHDHAHDHAHAHEHDHAHGHGHDHRHVANHGHAHAHGAGLGVVALTSPATGATQMFRLAASKPSMISGKKAHAHRHEDALVHSHGGSVHSHLPPVEPGERITWRSLVALGVSGGLIPCPSAMVLLLAAVALNKTAYGLLLVVAFSVGLAVTLTLVGLAFLYARKLFPRLDGNGRWARLLPVVSAALITVVGLVICYGAIMGSGAIVAGLS